MMDCFRRETIPAVITSGNNLFQRAMGPVRPGVAPRIQPKLAERSPARSSSMHRSIMRHTASIVPTRITRDAP